MSRAKEMLMLGLTERLHGILLSVLDTLDDYREFERFQAEVWAPASQLHIILGRLGRYLTRVSGMVGTLPAATDLNVVSTAIDGLEADDATPAAQGVTA